MTGKLYRYKYRARNVNGWGDFSQPGYIFAAEVPSKPAVPSLKSVTSTQMLIELYPPTETGGSDITSFELWIDQGTPNSAFMKVNFYLGLTF